MTEYVLCGSCIYYDKCDNCIKGACGVTVNLFKNGGDFVNKDNLKEVLNYLK